MLVVDSMRIKWTFGTLFKQRACKNVNSKEIENLTNSLDKRVMLVFEKKGKHIGM